MDDLLTTRQVQQLLKVGRITVYRMVQDGRLKGIKIGQQWRFPRAEVERFLGVSPAATAQPAISDPAFPTHCVQTIQDLFADLSQLSTVVLDMQGNPLTIVSHPTRFHQLIQSSPTGQESCRASYQSFARTSAQMKEASQVFTCASGLQYVGSPIFDRDAQIGIFLAGQFYWQPPDPREESGRLLRISATHNLPLEDLQAAARQIPVIDPAQKVRVEAWPVTAARAVMSILRERTNFMDRLQQIASLTQLG